VRKKRQREGRAERRNERDMEEKGKGRQAQNTADVEKLMLLTGVRRQGTSLEG
jgi:hypothetical protein